MNYHPLFSRFFKTLLVALAFALMALSWSGGASARNGGPILIRDTEIEKFLKDWSEPVIRASGLDPAAINFVLVQNSDINAFVAGGQNIFLFTGLLEKSANAGEVVGVIAHELGHIKGGHLVRTEGAMNNISYESMLGAVLGIGLGVLSGNGGVGAAVAAGTQSSAIGRFLAFSRVQEASADQSALDSLSKAGLSPAGLLNFMKTLESEEYMPDNQQTAWMRTHPLTRERIEALQAGYERSSTKNNPYPAAWQEQHARMMAKLKAFISPERIAWDYDSRDHSIHADYARAIADYRQSKVQEALNMMDGLLKREPDNPYFLELKGQMLADFGKVEQALPAYKRAVEIKPDAPLIRTAYAGTLIETSEKNKGRLDEAIGQLDRAVRDEPRSGQIYRLLATAWGRKGQEPRAKLYLAEEALIQGDRKRAKDLAKAAQMGLQPNSGPWLRAQDILAVIDQNKDGKKDDDDEDEDAQ